MPPGTICVRALTFTPATLSSLPAAGSPLETSLLQTTLSLRSAPRVAIWRPATNWSRPTLGPAQIIASNNFAVAGIVDAYGGVAIDLGIAVDELNATKAAIAHARNAKADAGDYDLIQQARLIGDGARLLANRHASRQTADARAFGFTDAGQLLRPLLRALHGEPEAGRSQPGRLAVDPNVSILMPPGTTARRVGDEG